MNQIRQVQINMTLKLLVERVQGPEFRFQRRRKDFLKIVKAHQDLANTRLITLIGVKRFPIVALVHQETSKYQEEELLADQHLLQEVEVAAIQTQGKTYFLLTLSI